MPRQGTVRSPVTYLFNGLLDIVVWIVAFFGEPLVQFLLIPFVDVVASRRLLTRQGRSQARND